MGCYSEGSQGETLSAVMLLEEDFTDDSVGNGFEKKEADLRRQQLPIKDNTLDYKTRSENVASINFHSCLIYAVEKQFLSKSVLLLSPMCTMTTDFISQSSRHLV